MKTNTMLRSALSASLAAALLAATAACGSAEALPVKALQPKQVEENPYMAKSDANIHHDGYNTDSTDEILPLAIYPEINVSYETTNANASPAIYFDSYGHAVVPLLGGIAIRDLNAEEAKTLGYFSPKQHDGGGYLIQSSYTFLDAENRIVCPTSNNHVLMLRATDEAGNVLPEFEKVLDIDVKAAAETALGKTLEQNLLSVVFDYEGNLWFATGGFRIYPERAQQGVVGYIAHAAIEAILRGEQADLADAVFVHELTPGEGAENGIAASKDGAVILTNQNCYLLRAENGVTVAWRTPYESVGAKVSGEGDKTTGGGLAWGGGCSPTLTPNLVMFTDNQDPVNLLALDMKTGEVVASCPVLDDLPEGYQVAVENSAIVYDDGEGVVSTIVCNWFGAGSAGLADPNSDSSIQSYANIYDMNWLMRGNVMIAPGVERVDTVKTADGYEMKSIWCRNDLSDTSILKLSTATGYIYGYVQDLSTGMWQYIILDFETGETVHDGCIQQIRLEQHGHRHVRGQQRQRALRPDGLSGAAAPAGSLRIPARDAVSQGRFGSRGAQCAGAGSIRGGRRRRQRRELAEHGRGSQRAPQHDGCLPHEQPLRRGCRFEALRLRRGRQADPGGGRPVGADG